MGLCAEYEKNRKGSPVGGSYGRSPPKCPRYPTGTAVRRHGLGSVSADAEGATDAQTPGEYSTYDRGPSEPRGLRNRPLDVTMPASWPCGNMGLPLRHYQISLLGAGGVLGIGWTGKTSRVWRLTQGDSTRRSMAQQWQSNLVYLPCGQNGGQNPSKRMRFLGLVQTRVTESWTEFWRIGFGENACFPPNWATFC